MRDQAASDWCDWEDAVLSLEPESPPSPFRGRPRVARLALVRIAAHYFRNGAWLPEGVLLREAGRLAGIPGVLVHGRLDLGSPPDTAWELTRRWTDARLDLVSDAGHTGSETSRRRVLAALDEFASA